MPYYVIGIKSGKRICAKSLDVYAQRYQPKKTIKLIGSQGALDNANALVLPLYYESNIVFYKYIIYAESTVSLGSLFLLML